MVLGVTAVTFEIQEVRYIRGPKYGARKSYTFFGIGPSFGLDADATLPGSWVYFDTPIPCRAWDFEGWGSIKAWGTYGVAVIGYSHGGELNFHSVYAHVAMPSGLANAIGATVYTKYAGWWEMRD